MGTSISFTLNLEEKEYKGCSIKLVKDKDTTKCWASVIVIPTEQKLSGFSEEFEALVDTAGDKFDKACERYIQENRMLKTGHSTCVPSGKLNCDKVIIATGPVFDSTSSTHKLEKRLLRDTIMSILDQVIDNDFSKFALPNQ